MRLHFRSRIVVICSLEIIITFIPEELHRLFTRVNITVFLLGNSKFEAIYFDMYFSVLLKQSEEDEVYTRDFAKPTLEDHFDKTIIPKVMQVGVHFQCV